jgi:hypothetical protein
VVKPASLAEMECDMHEEIELEIDEKSPIFDKLKRFLHSLLQKHSFTVALICASVPNPLLDLAGLACGHLLI